MVLFDPAVQIVLAHEGGWVSDPADLGGETNFGISLRSIVSTAHLSPQDLGIPNFDPGCMKLLTKDKAIEIYRSLFWGAPGHSLLEALTNQDSANKLMDAMVNMGKRGGTVCAQNACGATPDGVLGPNTLAKINAMGPNFENVLAHTMEARYQHIIASNPSQAKFAKNWFGRAACVSTARCICHHQ